MTEAGHVIRTAKRALQAGEEQQAMLLIRSAIEAIEAHIMEQERIPHAEHGNGTRERQLRAAEGTLRKVLFKVEEGNEPVIAVNGLSFALFHLGGG